MAIVDNDNIENVRNELVFTNEGRTLLVSQTGGIKFAILGFMFLVNNGSDVSLKDKIDASEELAITNHTSLMEELINNDVTFVMKGINYKIIGDDLLAPLSVKKYNSALEDYTKHLYGTFYLPATEYTTGPNGEKYGTYAFTFDRTDLNCQITQDLHFKTIALIGKQYAETSDATFDVSNTQDAGIVAFMHISDEDNGIQILKAQNNYVTFQCQLKFTISDNNVVDSINAIDSPDPAEPWHEYWNKRMALVNNGLKTVSGGITIGKDKEVLDELQLGTDGCVTMTKTLTVAEECLDADDAENQFNAAGLIHAINKYPEDGEYTPQILMTSVHATEDLQEDISAYTVGMTVKAEGTQSYAIGQDSMSGTESPTFKLGNIPENDKIAVDIFGLDNKSNMNSSDYFLFSNANSATMPSNSEPNVVIDSNSNLFTFGGSNNNNTLIKSSENRMINNARNSLLIGSNNNTVDISNNNVLLDSALNTINNDATKNLLIGSKNNTIAANTNTLIDATETYAGENANDFCIINSVGTSALGNSYDNVVYHSNYNTFSGTTRNSALICSDRNKLSDTTKNAVIVNSTDSTLSGAYDDYLLSNTHSFVRHTSKNDMMDDIYCDVVSACQNNIVRSRYLGVKGIAIGTIKSNENPIKSDVESNNNVIVHGEYFDLYGSSNNTIRDTYFLQSSDDTASKGPVRIKGTSVINSSKSKLYNAREMHLLNSEYSRVYVMHDRDNKFLGLNGSSFEMTDNNPNALTSIYYGEFYNTNKPYAAYYGLKGASYKYGAESIKDNTRPIDMLKLKTQFTNTFGSELNLSQFTPTKKQKYTTPVANGATFVNSNRTLMEPSIKPTNTNVIGGHHNKIIGGTNVTVLGGEYCKASSYSHQVIMGKYNRDVPADLIFGCGHFNGTSFIQNGKEYSEEELKTLETLGNTIDDVRGDTNTDSGKTCYNAMEFYAHQGKLILRNCDDGHDRGTNVSSNDFGKTVELDPTGIKWRTKSGTISGELDLAAIQANTTWTFVLGVDGWKTTNQQMDVLYTIGVPDDIASIDSKTLASYLCKIKDKNDDDKTAFINDEIYIANNKLFSKTIPAKINIILTQFPVNKISGSLLTLGNFALLNKIYPWYTNENRAPRYIENQHVEINYLFKLDSAGFGTNTTIPNIYFLKNTLNNNLTCLQLNGTKFDNSGPNMTSISYGWYGYAVDSNYASRLNFSIKADAFNTNTYYSEWIFDGTDCTAHP